MFISSLYAEVKNEYLTQKLLDSNIPIVDIRTTGEWESTGIVKGAIPIMFFDEKGNYDVKAFLAQLNKKVDTKKTFAIICRTGSRTKMVSAFLSKEIHYNVINLLGGITEAKKRGLPFVRYNH